MTTDLTKTEEIGKQIDQIVSECMPAISNMAPGFNEALTLARGIKSLREIFSSNAEIKETVAAMANTPLGFVTDRSPTVVKESELNPNKKTLTAYTDEEINECCIEAMLRGYRITGNEFNIMSGRFYAAKDGKYRKIIEYPGVTDFKFTTTPPAYNVETRMSYGKPQQDQFAKLRCFASWKKDGSKQFIGKESETGKDEDTLTFKIKAYGNDDDQVIGKAMSKLFSRVLMRITGAIMPEMTDLDDEPVTVETTSVDEASTDKKPEYKIEDKPETASGGETEDATAEAAETSTTDASTPPEDPKKDLPPDAEPYVAQDFNRKREATIKDMISDEARMKATPQHTLNYLWTKIENNKLWRIDHPLYVEWKAAQDAGKKENAGKFTGADTDKIIHDPDKKALKRIHASVRDIGLDPAGVKICMIQKFKIESSGDIEVRQVNAFINWLDDLVPAKNLVNHLTDAQKIMADSGKNIDLVALALVKIKEFSPKTTADIEHLYQLYDKSHQIQWIMDNMDSWLSEKPEEKQHKIDSKMMPEINNLMDVVNYAADLTGIPKDNPLDPKYTQLVAAVQTFVLESFKITDKELAAGLPDGIGEKFRDNFANWFEAQKF